MNDAERFAVPLAVVVLLSVAGCARSHFVGEPASSGWTFGGGGSGGGPAPRDGGAADGAAAPDAGAVGGAECMPSIVRHADVPGLETHALFIDSVDVDFPCGCDPDPQRSLARIRVTLRSGVTADVALQRTECHDRALVVPESGVTFACMTGGDAAGDWSVVAYEGDAADQVVFGWGGAATWCAPAHFDCRTAPGLAGSTLRACTPSPL